VGAVRPTAVAVIRHPLTGALLVDEIVEPGTGRAFHRLPGGGIDCQELAHVTVARELDEEYGLAVRVGRRLGVIESLFTFEGRPGHEIVLVYQADIIDPAACDFDRLPSRDASEISAVWRDPRRSDLELLLDEVRQFVGEPMSARHR
jgi:ADP-ribose pyrophosphatase YjhB (NUDIX family)